MPTKLMMAQILALSKVTSPETFEEKKIVLSGRGRMFNAANRMVLQPLVDTFEAQRFARWKEIYPEGVKDLGNGTFQFSSEGASPAIIQAAFEASRELMVVELDVVLQQFETKDLRLDDNPGFTEDMLIALRPLISDWPEAPAETKDAVAAGAETAAAAPAAKAAA